MSVIEIVISGLVGVTASWAINDWYYQKSTSDQRKMFNKLPAEIITPILADKRSRLSEEDLIKLLKYAESFGVEDWEGPLNGYYKKVVLGATHKRGVSPDVHAYETKDGREVEVGVDKEIIQKTGDVYIKVPADPDCRFAGKVSIG